MRWMLQISSSFYRALLRSGNRGRHAYDLKIRIPCTIPYDPQPRSIAHLFGIGIAVAVLNALPWLQSQLFLTAALAIIAASALLVLRRWRFRRSLVITEQVMLVPSGFLRLRPRSIALTDIQGVWATCILWTDILQVRSTDTKVEIQDFYLPEPTMLSDLKEFLEPFVRRQQRE